MRLLADLLIRIAVVVTLCLGLTCSWILVGTHRDIVQATHDSADRVALHLQGLYWQKLVWRNSFNRAELLPEPEWQSLATASVIAPGVCVGFSPDAAPPRRMCSGTERLYAPAPTWFANAYNRLFGGLPEMHRPLDPRQNRGEIVASADPETTIRLAWLQISSMIQLAAILAGAIGLLVALAVTRALLPVRAIVDGLRQLESGTYKHKIAAFGGSDLGRIARAVNDLADRLADTQTARAALTRQLFQVQEDERRALARDLHDEFGQCLAATSALAGSIAAGAPDRPDIVGDARAIGDSARRMMRALKEALVRLRSQDIDELGLEACLRDLVAKWNGRKATPTITLDFAENIGDVPRPIAIGLYRIAQECLTNATRHGAAHHVTLSVQGAGADAVLLCVEDDGGGNPDQFGAHAGHGLLGIRERIAALGGELSIARAAQGVRIAAAIPFGAMPKVATPAGA